MNELSGNATISLYEGSVLRGTRTVYCCGYRDPGGEVHSAYWPHRAFFCPTCGDIWAREVYDYGFTYRPIPKDLWIVEKRDCVKHGDGLLYDLPLEGISRILLTYIFNGLLAQFQGVSHESNEQTDHP